MSAFTDFLVGLVRGFLNVQTTGRRETTGGTRPGSAKPTRPSTRKPSTQGPQFSYEPKAGKTPDPGEVVWAWVPYEDDPSQGKTRPVLLLGRDGTDFVSVYFSSVDHDLDENQEAREGRYWVRVGSGSWDKKGRASYARVDRLLSTSASSIDGRAEVLDRARYDAVVAGVRASF